MLTLSKMLGLAQDIGLHLEPSEWNIDPQEIKTRRILWWSLYIHEKWLGHDATRNIKQS